MKVAYKTPKPRTWLKECLRFFGQQTYFRYVPSGGWLNFFRLLKSYTKHLNQKAMRTLLLGVLLLVVGCRRPSTQFAAMLTPPNQSDITDFSAYIKAGEELVAIGNDPGWSLAVNGSTRLLRFKATTGDSLNVVVPEQQPSADGTFRFDLPAPSGRFKATFSPDNCVDKLSQQRFDYRVEVDYNGKHYAGCGVSLRIVSLLQDIWVLTDLQGQQITPSANGREVPRLEISLTDARVTGTTGCNRLSGSVHADTHLIRFGPLVTTKMACVDNISAVESKFLNLLVQPVAYRVGDGKLTLFQQGKPVATFKKVD